MKKIILISIISLLTLSSITGIYFSVKYYRQLKSLSNVNIENSSQIEKLTSELEDLKKTNETLKNSLTIEQSIFYKTQECMKKENYTTAGMNSCVYDSVDDWAKEINKHLSDLKKITTKEQYALLQKAQKDWETYRKNQSIANSRLLLSKQGTIYTNFVSAMNVDIYKNRAAELDSLYSISAKTKKYTNDEILKLMGNMTPIKVYDPWIDSEKRANKILYEYLIQNYSDEIEETKKFFHSVEYFCEDSLNAIEFDLNDDGVNEIIGIAPQNPVWGGLASTQVFILGRKNGKYREIGGTVYTYPRGMNAIPDILVIFKEKTNGYHNMQFRKKVNEPTFIHLIKYLDNGYEFEFYR